MALLKLLKPSHRQKTILFKTLEWLPPRLGMSVYYKIQGLANKGKLEVKLRAAERSFQVASRILRSQQMSFENKVCVELGSGWLPILPYLLLTKGNAKRVDTYDVNEHYNTSKIEKLNPHFKELFDQKEWRPQGKYSLPESVRYFPKTRIEEGVLDEADIIISRFVLEHVPPDILKKLHQRFYEQLPVGGCVLHLISPSDHRAYSDSSLSLYDFLRFSEEEWNAIQTKFDYHNRLRLPQYLAIFKEHFEVIHVESNACKNPSESYDKFKKLEIHNDFAHFTEEELTAGSINVLLRKKESIL
ncbi:MAG: hypothetical protein AAF489_12275 [Bacteroidota bacterium]